MARKWTRIESMYFSQQQWHILEQSWEKGDSPFPFWSKQPNFSGANSLFVVGKVWSDPTELSRLLRFILGERYCFIVNRHETWGEASPKRTATQGAILCMNLNNFQQKKQKIGDGLLRCSTGFAYPPEN